jgi:hypothetical protein
MLQSARACPLLYRLPAVQLANSADLPCAFAIVAFTISAALAGMQAHASSIDLLRLAARRGCEKAMAAKTIRQLTNMANRLMGLMG